MDHTPISGSLDHPVGSNEDVPRNGYPQPSCGLQVDGELDPVAALNREILGSLAPEDPGHEAGCLDTFRTRATPPASAFACSALRAVAVTRIGTPSCGD